MSSQCRATYWNTSSSFGGVFTTINMLTIQQIPTGTYQSLTFQSVQGHLLTHVQVRGGVFTSVNRVMILQIAILNAGTLQ